MAVNLAMLLPEYFKTVFEFGEIIGTEKITLEDLERDIEHVKSNNYIQTCDEDTLAYHENELGIPWDGRTAVDYRRGRILQKLNTIVPFTLGFLTDRLTELYGTDGYELTVNTQTLVLTVKILSDRYGAIQLLYDLLLDIVPAHIQIVGCQENTKSFQDTQYFGGTLSVTKTYTIRQALNRPLSLQYFGMVPARICIQTIKT